MRKCAILERRLPDGWRSQIGQPHFPVASRRPDASIALMQRPDGRIPVRSEQQALDWSLVLVSQGIETAIERQAEDGRYVLIVPAAERGRAVAVLRQYERENRRRRWQQPLPWSGLLLDWRAVFCFVPVIGLFWLTDGLGWEALKTAGLMDSQAVRAGEWWRLVTAITLHADAAHLASNLATGILLLGLAMGSYGAGRAVLGALLAGAGANLTALLLDAAPHRGLGASGLVLGALGLLTVHSISLWRRGADPRPLVRRGIMAGCLLMVLLGFNPKTDVLAHVAGFVWGCGLGTGLALLPDAWRRSPPLEWVCAGLSGALVVGAWWQALV